MNNNPKLGKWTLLYFGSLVISFLLFGIIPLCFGFPLACAPILGSVVIFVSITVFRKYSKQFGGREDQ
jgi:hypothetical protein